MVKPVFDGTFCQLFDCQAKEKTITERNFGEAVNGVPLVTSDEIDLIMAAIRCLPERFTFQSS
jgi:hypothetical protein